MYGTELSNGGHWFFCLNIAAFHWLFIHKDKLHMVKIADQIYVLLQISNIFRWKLLFGKDRRFSISRLKVEGIMKTLTYYRCSSFFSKKRVESIYITVKRSTWIPVIQTKKNKICQRQFHCSLTGVPMSTWFV